MKNLVKVHAKLLIAIFILIGASVGAKETKSRDYLKYVDEIVDDFVKDVKKKYKLHCYGSGGSMPNDVEKIDVLFISYGKSLSVNDARQVEVNAVQELLRRINTHEKIRPYLREYPFNTDRVGVSISFRTETDDYPFDGSVVRVSIGKSKIFYYTAEMRMSDPVPLTRIHGKNEWTKELVPGKLQEELILLTEEPYEEALKIVEVTPHPKQK